MSSHLSATSPVSVASSVCSLSPVYLPVSSGSHLCVLPVSVSIHLYMEEKVSLTASRDGGLQNLEVHGLIMLTISDEKYGRIKITIDNNDTKGIQLQVGCGYIHTHTHIGRQVLTVIDRYSQS